MNFPSPTLYNTHQHCTRLTQDDDRSALPVLLSLTLSSRTFIADALELDLLLSTRPGQIGEVSGSVWQAAGGAGDDHHAATTEQLSASTGI